MSGLFSNYLQLTGKVLDLRLQRQNLVSANIANIGTQGYKAKSLEFEKDLQAALGLDARGKLTRTSQEHMPVAFDPEGFAGKGVAAFKPRVVYGEDNVDLDKEMTIMAKNNMMYSALTEVIKKQFSGLEKAIMEGSK